MGTDKRHHGFGIFSGKLQTFHPEVSRLEGMRNDQSALVRRVCRVTLPAGTAPLRWHSVHSRVTKPMNKLTPHVDLHKKFQLDIILFF